MSASVDHLFLCVRVPKSGSSSLSRLLALVFARQRTFLLPNTLDLDGRISNFQRLRFWRSRVTNLKKLYGTFDTDKAYKMINAESNAGDLIDGGHLDFPSVYEKIARPLKIISILRNPYERALSEYNYARQAFRKKKLLGKVDAGLLPKIAARNNFLGYLDFLHDHRDIYGNVASSYLGWNGAEPLDSFNDRAIFHCGVLEKANQFTNGLTLKLSQQTIEKPRTSPARGASKAADSFDQAIFGCGVLDKADQFSEGLTLKRHQSIEFPHVYRTAVMAERTIGAKERALIEAVYPRDFRLYEYYGSR